jgi:hypothetical protein
MVQIVTFISQQFLYRHCETQQPVRSSCPQFQDVRAMKCPVAYDLAACVRSLRRIDRVFG